MSRPGIEPGPPAWEASTQEKNHLDSLFAAYSEPLLVRELKARRSSTPLLFYIIFIRLQTSVGDPDPYVFRPPGSRSISQRGTAPDPSLLS
jgi:hypothetical protein